MMRAARRPAAHSGLAPTRRDSARRDLASLPGRGAAAALIAAALVAAAGAALAVQAPASGGHPAGHPGHPAEPAAAPAGPAVSGPPPLRLITGSHLVNGIRTAYPRSPAGAVSAAVEFVTELDSTLEPDRAAMVARLTASPAYPAAARDAAAGTITARRALGLPATGPVPPGTAVYLVPVMYQLRAVAASQLTVLLLFDYTQMTAAAIRERLGVTAVRLGWTPDGWRLLAPAGRSGAGPSGLLATPGTAGATARGWKAMTDVL